MFRKYTLQPAVWHQRPLDFEWDAESGEIRGPSADQVRGMVMAAVEEGVVVGHPYPTGYEIVDPLHNIFEMAVLLGQQWILTGDMAEAYPKIADDEGPPVLIDDSGTEHPFPEIH